MEIKEKIEGESPPLLLISHGNHNEKQCLYNVSENQFDTKMIPILCGKEVLGSSYGWLVLVDMKTVECCLWNPISTETIELPTLALSSRYDTCVLSKPPTESGCHVIFCSKSIYGPAFCQVGDEEFVVMEDDDKAQSLMAMESFEGQIYGFVSDGWQIVTFHFVGTTLEFKPICHVLIAPPLWATCCLNYLIKPSPSCDGQLMLVRKIHTHSWLQERCDFRVYEVDINRKECKEMESIGQRTIFVSHVGPAFCSYSLGTKPNSIYYTRGDRDSRNLYIYDLNDKSTTILLPSPVVERFKSMSFWVDHKLLCEFVN